MPKRVVFTCLIGGYEDLINQPTAADSDADFICFTDDRTLPSTSWQLEFIEPLFPFDLVRSQRDIKIRGHRLLEKYDEWLYIDNAVVLKEDPSVILEKALRSHDYAVSRHSVRETVLDEFDAVLALNYDDHARVAEQLIHYAETSPDTLEERPYWNGMFARRRTDAVDAMMRRWFDHVLRYSRRDQLSANAVFGQADVDINVLELDNNDSEWHSWPAGVNRRSTMTLASRRRSGPLLAEIRRLGVIERDLRARVTDLERTVTHTEHRAEELSATIAAMRSTKTWRLNERISRVRDAVTIGRDRH